MKKYYPHIVSSIFFMIALPTLSMGMQYSYNILSPTSWYVEYAEVKPEKDPYEVGEKLWFLSTASFKKEVNVHWNDRLFCKELGADKFFIYSSFASSVYKRTPSDIIDSKWGFEGELPDIESKCYLESAITVHLPFNIKKTQIYNGQEFGVIVKQL